MKRFLLFGGDQYHPSGGWLDFIDSFDTEQEAVDHVSTNNLEESSHRAEWYQIVDVAIGQVVQDGGFDDLAFKGPWPPKPKPEPDPLGLGHLERFQAEQAREEAATIDVTTVPTEKGDDDVCDDQGGGSEDGRRNDAVDDGGPGTGPGIRPGPG